jgi:ssDNA-binding Zn-finger/Zn-ribbon topoisomerase 1
MKRRVFLAIVLSLMTVSVFASNKVYKYRCPKCKLIQEYEVQGTKKCPNDGRIMIRVN